MLQYYEGVVEIFRHVPNAKHDATGAAVAGPFEIFRHAPNAMPDRAPCRRRVSRQL